MERNIEKLYEIIESQQIKIERMEKQLLEFKERYDYNDTYFQELIENLTYSVDCLTENVKRINAEKKEAIKWLKQQ